MNQLRGYYEATINGEKHGLVFNSNCFRLFSELKGIELHQLGDVNDFEGIRDLIWCAGRSWSTVQLGKEFPFTRLQVEAWFDSIDDSEVAKITETITHTRVFGIEIKAGVKEDETEKK